jgi:hypothetical protein
MENPALRTLNDSGFPLQVAVHRKVDETTSKHGWRVRYSEHAWSSQADSRSGFLDLVLEDQHGTSFMAVECKRPRDTEWVFLHSDGKVQKRAHAQAWISHYVGGSMPMPTFGWSHITLDPTCPEAQFCAVRGQSTSDRITLIEKSAAELILATECLALEHKDYRPPNTEDFKLFFSVIVTTARLTVAQFDPALISLQDGTLENAQFEQVPYVRFRKQLGVHHSLLTNEQYVAGGDISYLKESTVFIVSAEAVCDFLAEFEIRRASLRGF